MKTVNLEEILKEAGCTFIKPTTEIRVLAAMREACNQTVDLCNENFMQTCIEDSTEIIKESILDTKSQII